MNKTEDLWQVVRDLRCLLMMETNDGIITHILDPTPEQEDALKAAKAVIDTVLMKDPGAVNPR